MTKWCSHCREEQLVEAFGKDASRKDGLCYACRLCCNARSAAWRADHPEKAKAYFVAWCKANPEKLRASSVAWAKTNPEKVAAAGAKYYKANREEVKTRSAVWNKAHPEKRNTFTIRRRALKRGATGAHTTMQWKALLVAYDNRCAYCGGASKQLSRDHIVPLVRGGSNFIENIVPACASCNSSKGTKTGAALASWLEERTGCTTSTAWSSREATT